MDITINFSTKNYPLDLVLDALLRLQGAAWVGDLSLATRSLRPSGPCGRRDCDLIAPSTALRRSPNGSVQARGPCETSSADFTVAGWLFDAGLPHTTISLYAKSLSDQGFDNRSALTGLTIDDLQELNFRRGHARILEAR